MARGQCLSSDAREAKQNTLTHDGNKAPNNFLRALRSVRIAAGMKMPRHEPIVTHLRSFFGPSFRAQETSEF